MTLWSLLLLRFSLHSCVGLCRTSHDSRPVDQQQLGGNMGKGLKGAAHKRHGIGFLEYIFQKYGGFEQHKSKVGLLLLFLLLLLLLGDLLRFTWRLGVQLLLLLWR